MELFVLLAFCLCLLSFHNHGVESSNFETICVDIYKQPAFDHPALKNHKIQMKPSFLAKSQFKKRINVSSSLGENWQESGFKNVITCPKGKVPIQRPTKNLDNIALDAMVDRNDYARYKNAKRGVYEGVSAVMELRNPHVEADQYSLAEIAINGIYNDDSSLFNSLAAGWSVNPTLYGDNKTRATARWTVIEGDKIQGCYNSLCPGFVQLDPKIHLGLEYESTTVPGGTHYFTSFYIYQDEAWGNWWLYTGNDFKVIGYWPDELVSMLSTQASEVFYGGVTSASKAGVSPPMGSGEFASYDYERSCRFTDLKVLDQYNNVKDMNAKDDMVTSIPHPNCYGLVDLGGPTFSFGGPGGKCL